MPFLKKSEIAERKDKVLSISMQIADLQNAQNKLKEELERILAEELGLQNEQNMLMEEQQRILAEDFFFV